jgi:DNA repair protein RadC
MKSKLLSLRELPVSEHPGCRLSNLGLGSLSSAELIDLVVGAQVGMTLLTAAGSLMDLAKKSQADLDAVPGIGPATASRLVAALELGRRASWARPDDRPQISSPADAAGLFMAELGASEQEHFKVMLLDTKNRLLALYTLYVGNVNTSVIRISEVFREAIRRNATSIIISHNHPSGDSSPSPEDVRITRQIVEAGKLLSIDVLDHIIVGGNSYISLKERGLGFG